MNENIEEQNEYPISNNEQQKLWEECWKDAHESGAEYVYIMAKTQALFAYRVGVLNDRIIDHDLFEASDEELGLQVEDIQQ